MTSLLLVAPTLILLELLESGALILGNIAVKILEIASLGHTK